MRLLIKIILVCVFFYPCFFLCGFVWLFALILLSSIFGDMTGVAWVTIFIPGVAGLILDILVTTKICDKYIV